MLTKKHIRTKAPEEHKKTYIKFKEFAEKGIIDKELLKIYKDAIIKADALIGIFKKERKKRSNFTYRRLAGVNIEPARESIENTRIFFKHMRGVVV
jgi:hypothetical protein